MRNGIRCKLSYKNLRSVGLGSGYGDISQPKRRSFIVDLETGCKAIAKDIEKEVASSELVATS